MIVLKHQHGSYCHFHKHCKHTENIVFHQSVFRDSYDYSDRFFLTQCTRLENVNTFLCKVFHKENCLPDMLGELNSQE